MDISADQVRVALLSLIAFIVSVSVHEYGHALIADKLGDRVPRLQGRLTLSPAAHIDPLGTLLLPLIAGLMPGYPLIAWGKPVQTNPANYTRRFSTRTGSMLVSAAGPAMNLLLAILGSIVFVALGKAGVLTVPVAQALVRYVLAVNLALMFFNLIPLGPLDGAAVLAGILPESAQPFVEALRRYGMGVLFLLLLTGAMRYVMYPAQVLQSAWVDRLVRMVS
jgi:Zn-dependent protease